MLIKNVIIHVTFTFVPGIILGLDVIFSVEPVVKEPVVYSGVDVLLVSFDIWILINPKYFKDTTTATTVAKVTKLPEIQQQQRLFLLISFPKREHVVSESISMCLEDLSLTLLDDDSSQE